MAGVREVAGPDTFRESGALYATTQIKLGKKNVKEKMLHYTDEVEKLKLYHFYVCVYTV